MREISKLLSAGVAAGLCALLSSGDAEASALNLQPLCIGEELYETGRYTEALEKLREAREADPEDPEARLVEGLAHLRLGEPDLAEESWLEYLRRSDDGGLRIDVEEVMRVVRRRAIRHIAKKLVGQEQTLGGGETDPKLLAVVPFQNLAPEEFDALSQAIATLLTEELAKNQTELRVVSRDQVRAVIEEAGMSGANFGEKGVAARIGRILGAGQVTAGTFFASGDPASLQVQSSIVDVPRELAVGMAAAQAASTDLGDLILELVVQLADAIERRDDDSAPGRLSDPSQESSSTNRWANAKSIYDLAQAISFDDDRDYTSARRLYRSALAQNSELVTARRRLEELPERDLSLEEIAERIESKVEADWSLRTLCNTSAGPKWWLIGGGAAAAAGVGAGVGIAAASGGSSGGGGSCVANGTLCTPPTSGSSGLGRRSSTVIVRAQTQEECCSGTCASAADESTRCCVGLQEPCSQNIDCCNDTTTCGTGRCCTTENNTCASNQECCSGLCAQGTCQLPGNGSPSPSASSSPTCSAEGVSCQSPGECCSGNCDTNTDHGTSGAQLCCTASGGFGCQAADECCDTQCTQGQCCSPAGAIGCGGNVDCCGAAICQANNCCLLDGESCATAVECCNGTCDAGTNTCATP